MKTRKKHRAVVEKRIVVDKEKFDSLLAQMINTEPEPLAKIKTKAKAGSKKPLYQDRKSE